jgi:hypothetical protein
VRERTIERREKGDPELILTVRRNLLARNYFTLKLCQYETRVRTTTRDIREGVPLFRSTFAVSRFVRLFGSRSETCSIVTHTAVRAVRRYGRRIVIIVTGIRDERVRPQA